MRQFINFSNNKNFQIPEVAIIRPAKKAVPYSVIPIGDYQALLQWRKDQVLLAEAREAFLKPIREATRLRAINMVANQNADTSLNAVELAEIAHRKARNTPIVTPTPKRAWEVTEEPKKTFTQRLKGLIKTIWTNAGFES